MRRPRIAALLGVSALGAALIASGPAASAAGGGLQVRVTGNQVVITAGPGVTDFAPAETLVITSNKGSVAIVIDEGTARLWSTTTGCTQAPESSPVSSLTCTGSFTGVTVDFSRSRVTTQSAVIGTLPLTFLGGSGNDGVYGATGADRIFGAGGDDDLFGGSSDDTIDGGLGNDTVEGELGSDWMYGGPGADDVDAQDRIADREIDCGANVGDVVSYDFTLEQPVACNGPFVSLMHPQVGPQAGGPVKLLGRGLTEVKAVSFGGAAATILSTSDTEAVVLNPGGVGSATVSLDLGASTLRAGTYVYAPPPVLTAVSPNRGRVGTAITLSGTGLSRVRRVLIGGVSAQIATRPGGTVVVTAPSSRRLGPVDVNIVTAGGESTLSNAFRYTP
ncbi:MAG: IPT/TIG domain-containing protein [Candidatus Nanopelagicales bacterium]